MNKHYRISYFYKKLLESREELTLNNIIENIRGKYKISCHIPYGYPLKENFYLDEEFNDIELHKYRKQADDIFRAFYNYIYNNVSQNEKDMLGVYETYGDKGKFIYDIDENRKTSLYNVIDKNNEIQINTKFGKITFEFAARSKYNQPDDTVLGYEDETQKIVIFVDDPNYISRKELIDILRDRSSFDHELQHHLDKSNSTWSNETYDTSDAIAYLNNQNEFKANLQMIMKAFGKYLFKNYNQTKDFLNNLKSKDGVDYIFDLFLHDEARAIVSIQMLRLFRVILDNLNKENKEEFYKQLYKYTCDYYTKEHDIDLSESNISKDELIRLFRLGDNFVGL